MLGTRLDRGPRLETFEFDLDQGCEGFQRMSRTKSGSPDGLENGMVFQWEVSS